MQHLAALYVLSKLKKLMSHLPGRNQNYFSTHRGPLSQESLNCHWEPATWRCTAVGRKENAAIGCALMYISWNTHKFPLSASKSSVTALCANVGHLEKGKENDTKSKKLARWKIESINVIQPQEEKNCVMGRGNNLLSVPVLDQTYSRPELQQGRVAGVAELLQSHRSHV